MPATENPPGASLGRRLEGTLRNFYRAQRAGESLLRRALRRPRTVAESPNLLPLLIKVLAGFARVDGGGDGDASARFSTKRRVSPLTSAHTR